MIQVEKLYKRYNDVTALDGIDLNLREGVITGLLGPNGAGKTTLVSILTCVLEKSGGRVTVRGFDLDRNPDDIKSITGIVPSPSPFTPSLRPGEP